MATLNDLAPELFLSICQELSIPGRSSLPLRNLNLVCQRFHQSASNLLFQHVVIDLTAENAGKCAAFLDFLQCNAHVRSHIESILVPVRRYGWHGNHRDLQNAFIGLLPLLSRLRRIRSVENSPEWLYDSDDSMSIRFGGDHCVNYDFVDMRSIPRTILHAINVLPQPISLAIDCYVHTLDSRLDINKISCLESLRVCMVNIPPLSNHRGPSHKSFEDSVSTGVADIIHQNPRIKALRLCLQTNSNTRSNHESYQEVREHALKEIGRTVTQLDSLALEGDLLFNEAAWKTWNATCVWSHLRCLSITNMSLIETIMGRLKGQLPALRRLKLSAYEELYCFPHSNFHEGADLMKDFLSSLKLTHLSMLGFHPDILLPNMEPVGSTLQNIRFHIRENPTDLTIVRGPSFSTLLLSTAHITALKSKCTNIRLIGLDIPRSSLEGAGGDSAPSVPQRPVDSGSVGYRANLSLAPYPQRFPDPTEWLTKASRPNLVSSVHHPYGDAAFISSRENPMLTSSFWRQSPIPENDMPTTAVSILDTLATISSLRHIRLFIHHDENDAWDLSNPDAIATFQHLRSRKRGCALESLIICGAERGDGRLWIMWELGPQMATLEYPRGQELFRELWNTEDRIVQERETRDWDEWRAQPEWALAEGW